MGKTLVSPGRIVLIEGSSGVGKSTLVRNAEAFAREQGVLVVSIHNNYSNEEFCAEQMDYAQKQSNLGAVVLIDRCWPSESVKYGNPDWPWFRALENGWPGVEKIGMMHSVESAQEYALNKCRSAKGTFVHYAEYIAELDKQANAYSEYFVEYGWAMMETRENAQGRLFRIIDDVAERGNRIERNKLDNTHEGEAQLERILVSSEHLVKTAAEVAAALDAQDEFHRHYHAVDDAVGEDSQIAHTHWVLADEKEHTELPYERAHSDSSGVLIYHSHTSGAGTPGVSHQHFVGEENRIVHAQKIYSEAHPGGF